LGFPHQSPFFFSFHLTGGGFKKERWARGGGGGGQLFEESDYFKYFCLRG